MKKAEVRRRRLATRDGSGSITGTLVRMPDTWLIDALGHYWMLPRHRALIAEIVKHGDGARVTIKVGRDERGQTWHVESAPDDPRS